jgi:hypothetical protein
MGVQIGPAHPARADADDDLPGGGSRVGQVLQLPVAVELGHDGGAHAVSFIGREAYAPAAAVAAFGASGRQFSGPRWQVAPC